MGNALLPQYALCDDGAETDAYLKWRCTQARHKQRAGVRVTVFSFAKAQLGDGPGGAGCSAAARDRILALLRHDAATLQRLRHPAVLPVAEPLAEDASGLAFATQPVVGTLGALLAKCQEEAAHSREAQLGVEFRVGIAEIAEALAFIHNDARMVHFNVHPGSVFLTPSHRWCLGSFVSGGGDHPFVRPAPLPQGMSRTLPAGPDAALAGLPFIFSGRQHGRFSEEPPLAFSAPEVVNGGSHRVTPKADVFSLGLFVALLANPSLNPLMDAAIDKVAYSRAVGNLRFAVAGMRLPADVRAPLEKMLAPDPLDRPNINEVLAAPFINTPAVRLLRSLDSLVREKTDAEQLQILGQLKAAVAERSALVAELLASPRLLRERMLPPLLAVTEKPAQCVVALPIALALLREQVAGEEAGLPAKYGAAGPAAGAVVGTAAAGAAVGVAAGAGPPPSLLSFFETTVAPALSKLLSSAEIHLESVLALIDALPWLVRAYAPARIGAELVPFVVKCFGLRSVQVQNRLLGCVPALAPWLDLAILQNLVLPRVTQLIIAPAAEGAEFTPVAVRARAVATLESLAASLDKKVLVADLLPVLQRVSQDAAAAPEVILALARASLSLSGRLGAEVTATAILPCVCPLLVNRRLDGAQFAAVLATTERLLRSVEKAQRRVLGDLPPPAPAEVQRGELDDLIVAPPAAAAAAAPAAAKPAPGPLGAETPGAGTLGAGTLGAGTLWAAPPPASKLFAAPPSAASPPPAAAPPPAASPAAATAALFHPTVSPGRDLTLGPGAAGAKLDSFFGAPAGAAAPAAAPAPWAGAPAAPAVGFPAPTVNASARGAPVFSPLPGAAPPPNLGAPAGAGGAGGLSAAGRVAAGGGLAELNAAFAGGGVPPWAAAFDPLPALAAAPAPALALGELPAPPPAAPPPAALAQAAYPPPAAYPRSAALPTSPAPNAYSFPAAGHAAAPPGADPFASLARDPFASLAGAAKAGGAAGGSAGTG